MRLIINKSMFVYVTGHVQRDKICNSVHRISLPLIGFRSAASRSAVLMMLRPPMPTVPSHLCKYSV